MRFDVILKMKNAKFEAPLFHTFSVKHIHVSTSYSVFHKELETVFKDILRLVVLKIIGLKHRPAQILYQRSSKKRFE